LKPERWGSPLVQEKCRGEKACDKQETMTMMTTMIIKIIVITMTAAAATATAS